MLHEVFLFLILFCTGLFAGWVNTIAGGGGLITLPVFLAVGIPPQFALGTNKLQASVGSITASFYYWRGELVSLKEAKLGIFCTLIGAALGAWSVQQIRSDLLNDIIPVLMLATLLYTIFTPSLGMNIVPAKISERVFYTVFGLAFGFYDGFFGPGIGSFWIVAFVLALGFDLQKANGYAKLLNMVSNIVAFCLFLAGGYVWFSYGIMMALGQILGSKLGAARVLANGAHIVRPIFIIVVFVTTLKLMYDRFY